MRAPPDVATDRVRAELELIRSAIEQAVRDAQGRPKCNGRKIIVEIPLDSDGAPRASGTKVQPPWVILGRDVSLTSEGEQA